MQEVELSAVSIVSFVLCHTPTAANRHASELLDERKDLFGWWCAPSESVNVSRNLSNTIDRFDSIAHKGEISC